MDGGFRKLWSRKKSFSGGDQSSRPRRLSSSNGISGLTQSISSATKDGRPSVASSRQGLEQSVSREQPAITRELSAVGSGDEFGRTKSGHRIQPMLVGISRPGTGRDRPETAGSMQNAVQKAADAVGRRPSVPSDIPISQPVVKKSFQSSRGSSRHVDIFSVAAAVPSYLSRYNEDIAERNLDNYRLVLENTPYIYDPSSKYQEEVAIRNAYLPYKSRSSFDTSRRDPDRTTSVADRSVRSTVTPQPNGTHSHQPSVDSTTSPLRAPIDQPTQHLRQFSQRSRDGSQFPATVQENEDEDVFTNDDVYRIAPQPPYSPPRSQAAHHTSREARMQTIAEGQPYHARDSSGVKTPTQRDSGHASNNTFTEYKVSATEYAGRPVTNRSMLSDRDFDLRPNSEAMLGAQTTHSTSSSIRKAIVLPNRTILDLTGDEPEYYPETETSSAFGYTADSPVVEQAKSDAFRRIQPSQIHTEERRGSRDRAHAMNSSYHPDSMQFTPAPLPYSQPLPVYPEVQERTPISSGFSPISTVASWSPRSSAYITNITNTSTVPEPPSMTSRVAAILEANKATPREAQPLAPSRQGNETPTVRERVKTFESNSERGISPSASTTDIGLSSTLPKAAEVIQTPAKPIVEAVSETNETPTVKVSEPVIHVPTIYTSPESITSIDYTNPGNVFGVRTRDFALSPRQSMTVPSTLNPPKVIAKPQPTTLAPTAKVGSKTKNLKPRAKTNTPAIVKPKESEFDEEAFARKQAEARAAIEKLQRSLSEDFITLPDVSTVRNSKGKEQAREVESEGRSIGPIAPALVLPRESRNSASTTSTQRTDSEKAPPSSFRNSRGSEQRVSLASNSRSLSTGSRSSKRAPAPSSLKNVEPATNPIDQSVLSPPLLHAMQTSSKPPRSPGEISLSSFPVPSSSRPPSQPDAPTGFHSHSNSLMGAMKRKNSTKSQGSTASAFSIPLHMVPGRTSSVRDPVPEEVDPMWG